MNQPAIELYISQLPYNEAFTSLPEDVRTRIVFGSNEMLKRRYAAEQITDEIIAVQSLFVAEGEGEEFAKFKRQGVTNINLDGLAIAVKGSEVSPEVIALLGEPGSPASLSNNDVYFGRLL